MVIAMKKQLRNILIPLLMLTVGCTPNQNSSSVSSTGMSSSISSGEDSSSMPTTSQNGNTSNATSSSSLSSSTSSQQTSSSSKTSSNSSSVTPSVDAEILAQGVLSEGAYAEWSDTNAQNAKVEYQLVNETGYTRIDQELIRKKDNTTARFDAVGLKAGIYNFKITTSDQKVLEMKNIEIKNYDRSGYAHFKATGVGGYNDDGTPKANAVIVYVNDENKNTVTAQIGGKTYEGIAEILKHQSESNKPLIIRIVGRVNAATWKTISYSKGSSNLSANQILDQKGQPLPKQNMNEDYITTNDLNQLDTSKYSKLNGLTNKINYSSGEFDSYYNMLDVNAAKNVTIEGIGDAMIFQWGFTFKNCSSIEVRNLTFDDYTEDACSFEGPNDAETLAGFTTGHIWLHNNLFNEGKNYWDVCPEQDKLEGDGATDFKKNAYITISYNQYYNNHKTGLVGGGDTQHTACLTFHHNYYNQCSQRLPLGRQANMHMYNNYYYKTKTTSMSIRANAYAFVENCYFEGGKNPMETKSTGVIKSYNNVFDNCPVDKTKNTITEVTDRDTKVGNSNIYDQNFDTNPSNFYYDAEKHCSNVTYLSSANQAKQDCKNFSGPLKANIIGEPIVNKDPEEEDNPNVPQKETEVLNFAEVSEGKYSTNLQEGIFTIYAASDKTVEIKHGVNNYTSFDASYTGELKLGGNATSAARKVSFAITKQADITIYARSSNDSTARQLVIKDSGDKEIHAFDAITTATELKYTLEAGTYSISSKSGGMNIGAIKITYKA